VAVEEKNTLRSGLLGSRLTWYGEVIQLGLGDREGSFFKDSSYSPADWVSYPARWISEGKTKT
jgi:hypothetical protein